VTQADSSTDPTAAGVEPRRIVLHPRTASARRIDRSRTDGGDVRGYTVNTDEVLGYMRAHRRLALRTFLPVVATITMLLVITTTWSDLGTAQFQGVPVLWLLLGPVALFSILLVTVLHERRALRLEDHWIAERQ